MEETEIQTIIKHINYFIKKYGETKKKEIKVKLFGVGTYGCTITDKISSYGIETIDMYAINYNKQKSKKRYKNLNKISSSVTKSEKQIIELLKDTHILYVVMSDKSDTAKCVMPKIIDLADKLNVMTLTVILSYKNKNFDITYQKSNKNFLTIIPEIVITKKISKEATSDDFYTEFTELAIKEILGGVFKRMLNVDNQLGELK